MIKIVTIVGARPQFIKAAVVSRAIAGSVDMKEVIVHTGQHFDPGMSDIFFTELQIPTPDYNLAIGGGSHGQNTGRMIEAIESVLKTEQPNWVLVYGDTDSTLAGAIAASKMNIKLAHVEAGLRSFNMRMPEEVNRILTDRISDLLFCPTSTAVANLKKEGFDNFSSSVIKTGDVMYDAALFYKSLAKPPGISDKLAGKQFALCTIHRAENTDSQTRIHGIFEALKRIANTMMVVVPLHPRTVKMFRSFRIETEYPNLYFIEPVGYLEMVWFLQRCSLVLTDSGGLQKEAYFFEKKCITMRDETEWIELVASGTNQLAGADTQKIVSAFETMKSTDNSSFPRIYGDGHSADQIVKELLQNA